MFRVKLSEFIIHKYRDVVFVFVFDAVSTRKVGNISEERAISIFTPEAHNDLIAIHAAD